MLTSDLVRARVRGGLLELVPMEKPARRRAETMAQQLLAAAETHVGRAREDLTAAFGAVECGPRDRRLRDGLRKLVEDGCEFDAEPAIDPEELRSELFLRASSTRRAERPLLRESDAVAGFDRAAVIGQVAARHQLTPAAIDEALYADLRSAHKLQRAIATTPAALVDEYQLGQAQAVLLRAVRVEVDFSFRSAASYRHFFRKLKFLRLLYTLTAGEDGAYHLSIDGPYSLFDSVTRYGLSLALLLPLLRTCDQLRLDADIRWGKERVPLRFRYEHGSDDQARPKLRTSNALPDEVARLLTALDKLQTPWRARAATTLLDLKGVGLCIPDLTFVHEQTGVEVHLEVLGHWSRPAVWKRIELVERGLADRVLFAVSEHLRVSEEALDGQSSSALYVYKRTLHARTLLDKIDAIGGPRPRST